MPLIGPFCRCRLVSENFSLPSALKIGVIRNTIDCSQSACCPMRELAQQHLRRFLAFDLAGVDVALDVDAQLAGRRAPPPALPSFSPVPTTASGMSRPSKVLP